MSDSYWVRRGAVELGPMPLRKVRAMVLSGELGRAHQVSTDDRHSWREVGAIAELWEDERAPIPPPPPPPVPSLPPEPPEPRRRRRRRGSDAEPSSSKSNFNALGLSGFICSVVGLLLTLIPLLIWALQVDSTYSYIPVAFPFLVISATGLVLSVVGLLRQPRGFATAGLVVGIVASLLGTVTCVGWLVSPDPRQRWIDEALKVTTFDVEFTDREFDKSLRMYRDGSAGMSDAELLQALTLSLMKLTRAHGRHVVAASRTPRFRRAFTDLDRLRAAYEDYRDSISVKSNIKPREAIDQAGEDQTILKELLDILDLYRTQKISLETAQAKCRELGQ